MIKFSVHLQKNASMRKLLLGLTLSVGIFAIPSCKEEVSKDAQVNAMLNDSISTILPACQSFRSHIGDDHTSILVVDGDLSFYDATPEVKTQKAEELGKMILRFYGKDNKLETGTLTVTRDTRNTIDEPKDGISIPIPIAALKKAGY